MRPGGLPEPAAALFFIRHAPPGIPMILQNLLAQGMEGLDGEPLQAGKVGQQVANALCHFGGGLPGEGKGQDGLRVHSPAGDEISQAVGEGPGLAGARTRLDDEGRPLVDHRLPLGGIQARQQGIGGGGPGG